MPPRNSRRPRMELRGLRPTFNRSEWYARSKRVINVASRRPETMKRGTVIKCDKVKMDERRRQVVYSLSPQSSEESLTRVAQKRPKLLHRQAPEERGGDFPPLC